MSTKFHPEFEEYVEELDENFELTVDQLVLMNESYLRGRQDMAVEIKRKSNNATRR